jgi:hypothetical protein
MALALIMILYVSIGALSAVGSMYLSHRCVPARFESAVYALFLIPIAALYLAFTAYFGDAAAWNLEMATVIGFTFLSGLGTRLPVVLVAGYALHGA